MNSNVYCFDQANPANNLVNIPPSIRSSSQQNKTLNNAQTMSPSHQGRPQPDVARQTGMTDSAQKQNQSYGSTQPQYSRLNSHEQNILTGNVTKAVSYHQTKLSAPQFTHKPVEYSQNIFKEERAENNFTDFNFVQQPRPQAELQSKNDFKPSVKKRIDLAKSQNDSVTKILDDLEKQGTAYQPQKAPTENFHNFYSNTVATRPHTSTPTADFIFNEIKRTPDASFGDGQLNRKKTVEASYSDQPTKMFARHTSQNISNARIEAPQF